MVLHDNINNYNYNIIIITLLWMIVHFRPHNPWGRRCSSISFLFSFCF